MTTDTGRVVGESARPSEPAGTAPRGRSLVRWLRPRRPRSALPEPLRRRRRRLLLVSAPLVMFLTLLGIRLVTLNAVHDRTLAAYQAGESEATLEWGGRQGWLNVVERFRAPFAVGDAHVLAGRFDLARTSFEEALSDVPPGGVDECKVRVNLGLTYERLGDDALGRERPQEARQFYEKGIRVTQERPPVCDLPDEGEDTGPRLDGAQERMQQQLEGMEQDGEPPSGQSDQAQPSPPVDPTPDPEQAPSEQQQEELERQQRENTAERNRQLGTDREAVPDGDSEVYPRPW